jgi:hypothetical protein
MDLCEECAFDYESVTADTLAERLAVFGPRYQAALGAVADLRRRPAEHVWSPLEYTCHVRDLFRVQRERLALGLRQDGPAFAPMDRELSVRAAYNSQDPAVVVRDLAAAADELAVAFGLLGPQDLARTGVFPWPEPAERTLLWLGRHSVHEGEHHLMDIGRTNRSRPVGSLYIVDVDG